METHCPLLHKMRRCIEGYSLPIVPCSVVVYRRAPTHCPLPSTIWQCTEGCPLNAPYNAVIFSRMPNTRCPLQCGGMQKDTQCPLRLVVRKCFEGYSLSSTLVVQQYKEGGQCKEGSLLRTAYSSTPGGPVPTTPYSAAMF